jgi:hypothetical protein
VLQKISSRPRLIKEAVETIGAVIAAPASALAF